SPSRANRWGGPTMPEDLIVGFSESESEAALAQSAGDVHSLPANSSPEPIVKPRVRLISQIEIEQPWTVDFMRGEGQRNITAMPRLSDDWLCNGCYPTCIAMLQHWWTADNPETTGLLDFPFQPQQSELDPPEMCRRLFGVPSVPCVRTAVPPDKQDKK